MTSEIAAGRIARLVRQHPDEVETIKLPVQQRFCFADLVRLLNR